MNTKPRAKKFRVRKSMSLADRKKLGQARAEAADAGAIGEAAAAVSDGEKPAPKQKGVPKSNKKPVPGAKASEQLTGRQLRMARRLAERRGIKVNSDEEAVAALRAKGIDPFSSNRLQIVPNQNVTRSEGTDVATVPQKTALPQKIEPKSVPAHSIPQAAEDKRAAEIMKMQQEIAQRRRKLLINLGARLFAFVLLPTLLAGFYFAVIASPMYSTNSEFIIQQADPPSQSGLAGALAGTSLANSQDSIGVQSFLLSREAMLRLDDDLGFRAHYSSSDIDILQRLDTDASMEAAYNKYRQSVKIGYDPTEGIVRMEVIAADPDVSLEFSHALIGYAEEWVDQQTQRIRTDQMAGASESLSDAEAKMIEAQQRVLNLQEARGVLSAEAEVSSLMSQISTFEVELKQEQLALQSLLDNQRPNRTKVAVAERNISRLEDLIAEMRSEMTEGNAEGASLARITGELVIAEAELETRQMMLSQALQQMETARIEANRQVRYLLLGVKPVAPDVASYPKVFDNTLVAFLLLGGLYLMLSLTISILREQVSA